jgi:hypothetical protein
MFGKILPQVKIVVTQTDLESGTGFAVNRPGFNGGS